VATLMLWTGSTEGDAVRWLHVLIAIASLVAARDVLELPQSMHRVPRRRARSFGMPST
jgi:hypothetical protein